MVREGGICHLQPDLGWGNVLSSASEQHGEPTSTCPGRYLGGECAGEGSGCWLPNPRGRWPDPGWTWQEEATVVRGLHGCSSRPWACMEQLPRVCCLPPGYPSTRSRPLRGSQSSAPVTAASPAGRSCTWQSSGHHFPSCPFALLKDAAGWSHPGSRPCAQAAFWGQRLRDRQKM